MEDADAVFESVRILSSEGELTSVADADDGLVVEITYSVRRPVRDLAVFMGVMKEGRILVFVAEDTDTTEWSGRLRDVGSYRSSCQIPGGLLAPGDYVINIGCHVPGIRNIAGHRGVVAFSVPNAGFWLTKRRPGAIAPRLQWDVVQDPTGWQARVVG